MRRAAAAAVTLMLACSGSGSENTDDTSRTTSGASDTDVTTDGSTMSGSTTVGSTTTTSTTGTPMGTPGCGLDATPGATDRTIDVDGMTREYKLVYPMVFAWHARGTSASLARTYYKVEEASKGAAVFVYPEGLPIESQGGQTGWDLTADGIDIAFFDAMANELVGELCLDVSRIYSTGHSFGAFMSQSLACFRGEYVRAIGAVAGGGPYGACSHQVAAWIAHGMSDATVPYSEGEGSRDFWQTQNECGDTSTALDDPTECVEFDGCTDGFPLVWCAHDEPDLSGHGWPLWAGPAIWEFFARF